MLCRCLLPSLSSAGTLLHHQPQSKGEHPGDQDSVLGTALPVLSHTSQAAVLPAETWA